MSDHRVGGASHGSYRSYTVGFILAIVLTAIPFILVMTTALPATALVVTVGLFALAQIGVHLVFFLHLNRSSAQRWNLIVFAYTLVILAILVGASVWVLYHLNANMMPQ
jgi:cytochrome o ubiquinol oxidase subunit IV